MKGKINCRVQNAMVSDFCIILLLVSQYANWDTKSGKKLSQKIGEQNCNVKIQIAGEKITVLLLECEKKSLKSKNFPPFFQLYTCKSTKTQGVQNNDEDMEKILKPGTNLRALITLCGSCMVSISHTMN